MKPATKAELFAWRNKGYDDAVAGRPISEAAEQAPANARRVYLEGRRCAEREREKGSASSPS